MSNQLITVLNEAKYCLTWHMLNKVLFNIAHVKHYL